MTVRLDRLRAAYASWSLRLGSMVLVLYAAAGAMVGIEVFALVITWPVGIGLAMLAGGGATLRKLSRQPKRPGPPQG